MSENPPSLSRMLRWAGVVVFSAAASGLLTVGAATGPPPAAAVPAAPSVPAAPRPAPRMREHVDASDMPGPGLPPAPETDCDDLPRRRLPHALKERRLHQYVGVHHEQDLAAADEGAVQLLRGAVRVVRRRALQRRRARTQLRQRLLCSTHHIVSKQSARQRLAAKQRTAAHGAHRSWCARCSAFCGRRSRF